MDTQSPVVGPSKPRLLDVLGPGLITGASDDDPSGIATYSQAGAQFGFALSWTLLFTYPLMAAIQEISARVGRTTGHGIAANLRRHYPPWVALVLIPLLFLANTINLGADLGAMADALSLLVGGPHLLYVVVLGAVSLAAQVFLQYTRYVSVLKWLTLSLLAYFGTVLVVKVPWGEALSGLFIPTLSADKSFWTTVVAVLGTTISPYLFFWQASQEVEDTKVNPQRDPLVKAPEQAPSALARIRLDTLVGMAFSNLVALAILFTTAATLHAHGITDIQTTAQAAQALEPVAGRFAFTVFALGVLGTGFLGIPALAGSAAYALGEFRRWPTGLDRRPVEAKAFYVTLSAATVVGALVNFSPIDPISALFWSAVINGLIAVPMMALLMLMTSNPKIMGRFPVRGALRVLGWTTTVVMGVASVAFFGTWIF
ncbi:MAG: Nramp family divalent metal transporter [Actinomycetota bacterium]|nr:Nramp family divalent metal transporter [Actinomycetota bacterium]